MQPLTGLRLLDASHVVAGPFASYQLHLMGAEVIRIDSLDATDFVRYHGGTEEMRAAGLGASHIAQSAGKRSIRLNLKDPRGKDLFKRLAATSDALLENFRPGVMDRLGLGYDAIRDVRPDIVYCSLTGYGPTGPMRDAPAYDHIVQGVCGLMSTTGTRETGPMRSGIPITDYLAGFNAVIAILAALYQRRATGEGQHINVTMLASALPTLAAAAAHYQTTGELREPTGNQPFSDSPFAGRFETADGFLMVTANTPAQAANLITALGISDLSDELALVQARRPLDEAQKKKAAASLRQAFLTDTALAWEAKLSAASVPAGKVRTIDEVFALDQLAALGCIDQVPALGIDGTIGVPGLGFSSNLSTPRDLTPPERAGQSTHAVLAELGISETERQELIEAGVIATGAR